VPPRRSRHPPATAPYAARTSRTRPVSSSSDGATLARFAPAASARRSGARLAAPARSAAAALGLNGAHRPGRSVRRSNGVWVSYNFVSHLVKKTPWLREDNADVDVPVCRRRRLPSGRPAWCRRPAQAAKRDNPRAPSPGRTRGSGRRCAGPQSRTKASAVAAGRAWRGMLVGKLVVDQPQDPRGAGLLAVSSIRARVSSGTLSL